MKLELLLLQSKPQRKELVMGNSHYNVAPRWSSGSPAMVDRRTAIGVAGDEQSSHSHALQGFYGEDKQRAAQAPGALSGIVEHRHESGRGWFVRDLLTGEYFYRWERGHRPTAAQRAAVRRKMFTIWESADYRETVKNVPDFRGLTSV
jgi:hypothetical protein